MAAKKIILEEEPLELTPIEQYELGLYYEKMADSLQIEEYKAVYYMKARDIMKLLVGMEISLVDPKKIRVPETKAPEEDEAADEPEDEEKEQENVEPEPEPETPAEDAGNGKTKAEQDPHADYKYLKKALSKKNLKKVRDRVRIKMYNSRALTVADAYEKAAALRDSAQSAAELRYAAEQFEGMKKLSKKNPLKEQYTDPALFERASACTDYKAQAAALRERAKKMEQRVRFRLLFTAAAVVVLALAAASYSRTSSFLKLKGDAEMALGMEDKAWQAYGSAVKDMGREDLRDVYNEARKQSGVKAYNDGRWKDARTDLREPAQAGDAEADAMYADAEREVIKTITPGSPVHFAGTDWTVLENTGSHALLMRAENIPEVPFSATGEACTWADSSLRTYLNGAYLKEKFTPAEIALLMENDLPEEVSQSGEVVNPATTDTVYIFSAYEFRKYKGLFPEFKKATWLRTPGDHFGMQAFAYIEDTVMPHGYDVGTSAIRVKPVIRVRLTKG